MNPLKLIVVSGILLFLAGCSGIKVQRQFENNTFRSSYPKITIRLDSRFVLVKNEVEHGWYQYPELDRALPARETREIYYFSEQKSGDRAPATITVTFLQLSDSYFKKERFVFNDDRYYYLHDFYRHKKDLLKKGGLKLSGIDFAYGIWIDGDGHMVLQLRRRYLKDLCMDVVYREPLSNNKLEKGEIEHRVKQFEERFNRRVSFFDKE